MPDGKRLCDYCSDSWVAEANKKPVHKPREYNNTKWLIKQKYGTIKQWAISTGFNLGVVNQILNKAGYYAVADLEVMSVTHLDVLMTLEKEGWGQTLVADGYINN
jgi:hypothetical protein